MSFEVEKRSRKRVEFFIQPLSMTRFYARTFPTNEFLLDALYWISLTTSAISIDGTEVNFIGKQRESCSRHFSICRWNINLLVKLYISVKIDLK